MRRKGAAQQRRTDDGGPRGGASRPARGRGSLPTRRPSSWPRPASWPTRPPRPRTRRPSEARAQAEQIAEDAHRDADDAAAAVSRAEEVRASTAARCGGRAQRRRLRQPGRLATSRRRSCSTSRGAGRAERLVDDEAAADGRHPAGEGVITVNAGPLTSSSDGEQLGQGAQAGGPESASSALVRIGRPPAPRWWPCRRPVRPRAPQATHGGRVRLDHIWRGRDRLRPRRPSREGAL